MPIKSTYNFVPLSNRVFFPDWSDKVSMDIPFEDGISGELEIVLTADTDIYTRESYGQEQDENQQNGSDFFRITPDGNYAIPGTSIKGVIRNVLEIASFSKIVADDQKYSLRDLTRDARASYGDKMKNAQAGWLYEDEVGHLYIRPCKLATIEQTEIERKARVKIGQERGQTSLEKYQRCHDVIKNSFIITDGKAIFSKNPNQGIPGTLVLTGQPSPRKPGAKHREFVFYDENKQAKLEVSEKVYKEFCFVHSEQNGNKSKPNTEWGYWKPKLQQGEPIPVFYITNGRNIESIGLARMYRLPYKYSIKEAICHTSREHYNTRKDFAETLFGYIDDQDALRGRVSFSVLESNVNTPLEEEVTTVLGSPKPTFYPFYLKRETGIGLIGYMNNNCQIRGWKRYPYRPTADAPQAGKDQKNVATSFKPLPKGTKFTGKIRLHNVKSTELGGLIWALTFGGMEGSHHSVGMAKPFGYGAATINITKCNLFVNKDLLKINDTSSLNAFMNKFIMLMEANIDNWATSEQILNLLAMSQTFNGNYIEFKYPILDSVNRINEFVDIKKAREELPSPLTHNKEQELLKILNKKVGVMQSEIAKAREKARQNEEKRIQKEALLAAEKEKQKALAAEQAKREAEEAEAARKAAMSPEEIKLEELGPKLKEVTAKVEKETKKPFNIGQCNFFQDVYKLCDELKCSETKALLEALLAFAMKGPKKNNKIKEVKDKINIYFPQA